MSWDISNATGSVGLSDDTPSEPERTDLFQTALDVEIDMSARSGHDVQISVCLFRSRRVCVGQEGKSCARRPEGRDEQEDVTRITRASRLVDEAVPGVVQRRPLLRLHSGPPNRP